MNDSASNQAVSELANRFDAMAARFHALHAENVELRDDNARLKQQLEWFKRQVFGVKSEKRIEPDADQAALFNAPIPADAQEKIGQVQVPAHSRLKHRTGTEVNDTGLRFGPQVPVREITLKAPELQGPDAHQYEIISYRETLRLARQPGSHVVLKYRRPVIKRRDDATLRTVAAPVGVFDAAQLDVSFVAGLLIDKFVYHCPLYRQHQRLTDEGITMARSSLDQRGRDAIALLVPIADAQLRAMLQDQHLKIDETPIKAGRTKARDGPRAGQGQMKTGWIWPVLGEHGDIAFVYCADRGSLALKSILGQAYSGTIQTDGYKVYANYSKKLPGCTHALCWAHTRRALLKAEASEPQHVAHALGLIRRLYAVEAQLREQGADAQKIISTRQQCSAPILDEFFAWVEARIGEPSLLPKSPLAQALAYAKERQAGLRVFLTDAWLDLDTNDLERALRVIPMGKKNWMFCMTELGAQHVAAIQTLLASCRAHGIDAFTYLVDVLQRINLTANADIIDLTPRIWAQKFGHNPLRSDLYSLCQ
jgi:transposase